MKKLLVLSAFTFFLALAISAEPGIEFAKNNKATSDAQGSAHKNAGKKESSMEWSNDVSDQSKDQFYEDFGNIPEAQWKRAGIYDEASFIKDGFVVHAYYDTDAQLVGTTVDITFAELPSKAQKMIGEKYKDYAVGDVILYRDSDNGLDDGTALTDGKLVDGDSYFVELKKMDKEALLQFKSDGGTSYYPLPRELNNGYARK